uniref:Uncharacterized protein n=1 Tax=Arundo donax TaxID=35708 RepID=A0A0A8Z4K1_ARUDO
MLPFLWQGPNSMAYFLIHSSTVPESKTYGQTIS